MSSAALINLQTAINTNTLSPGQQSALSAALDAIIPFFPTPGEGGAVANDNEPALARDWFCALYAIAFAGGGSSPVTLVNEILQGALPNPVTVTPNPGVGDVTLGFDAPSRAAAFNGATPVALSATPTNAVDVLLTPSLTGRLRAMLTGRVTNTDSSPHAFVVNVNGNTGTGPDFTIQTLGSITVPAGSVGSFAITIDCDQGSGVTNPHTFATGIAATIIASVSGVAGGFLSIPANGIFLSVQEMFG